MKTRAIILKPDEEVIIYVQPEGYSYERRIPVAQVQLKLDAKRATVYVGFDFEEPF